jgi:2'-5' RNA ligase
MRLFVALLPPLESRSALVREVEKRRAELPRARWVRVEHLHLTLAFLGEVAATSLAPLAAALAARVGARRRFRARLTAAGGFPPRGPVRVVWAGLEPAPELAELATAARAAVADAGLASDDKPFLAHLTLARCPQPWPPQTRAALDHLLAALAPTEFAVERVALIESVLAAGGPTYTTRAESELGANA